MKDNKLHNAIANLPEFEAPDVWPMVLKELSSNSDRKHFFLALFIILSVGIALFLVNLTSGSNQRYYLSNTELPIKYSEVYDTVFDDIIIGEVSPVFFDDINIISNDENNFDNESEIIAPQIGNKEISIVDNSFRFEDLEIFAYKNVLVITETGENIVNNPSFEDFTICPKGIVGKPEKRLIPFWDVPSKGTPDYFNSCCNGEAGVPKNFAGKINAKTGKGYCGIILRQNFTRDNKITGEKPLIYREYIQTELKSELVAGKKYRVRFYICNSSNSRFAVDAIGACLTTTKVRINTNEVMEIVPVVSNSSGQFLTNQTSWLAIEGVYQAVGGEKYLTIGNFYNNYATNYMMQNGDSKFNYAYYYVDDVSVIEVEELYETRIVSDSVDQNNNYCSNSEF